VTTEGKPESLEADLCVPTDDTGIPEVERRALAAAFLDGEACSFVMAELQPRDFALPRHASLFQSITDLRRELDEDGLRSPCDLAMVYQHLEDTEELPKVGGLQYLAELLECEPFTPFHRHYCRRIKEASRMRRLRSTGTMLEREEVKGPDELLGLAKCSLSEIEADTVESVVSVASMADPVVNYYFAHQQMGGGLTGVTSGLVSLDRITNGWQAGEVAIIGARPSVGKTAFGLALARNATRIGQVPVLYFSLEMSRLALMHRLVAMVSRVPAEQLRNGTFSGEHTMALAKSVDDLSEGACLLIDDTGGLTAQQIASRASRAKAAHGVGLVIVDHMHLIAHAGKVESQTHEVTKVSAALHDAAKSTGLPFLVLAQLNRAPEQKKRPTMADLRQSGAIEQDADLVMLLHREDYQNQDCPPEKRDLLEVNICKQRNGPTGTVELHYNRIHGHIADLEGDYRQPEDDHDDTREMVEPVKHWQEGGE
jgi:replicative DNA helicase